MKKLLIIGIILMHLLSIYSCNQNAFSESPIPTPEAAVNSIEFKEYWYAGAAEVSSFKLEQARYGEMRDGNIVMVFVTEDYSKSKHIKINNAKAAGSDLSRILKLNMTRDFTTGIYPYTMMLSVFTPIDLKSNPNTFRTTLGSQEWCGHTFTMLDLKEGEFKVKQHSYFEDEGDIEYTTANAFLEDEIWTRIRISPESLPEGKIQLIPSGFYSRFKHIKPAPYEAEATLSINSEDKSQMDYKINYQKEERSLLIRFEKEFPYRIMYFEESYKSGWGEKAKILTTKATRIKTILSDYWSKNQNIHYSLRDTLGLN